MSRAHPQDRAFRWVIYALVASVPIGIIINGLYPIHSRRIWIDVTDFVFGIVFWAINPFTVAVVFYGGIALLVLGVLAILYDWLRRLFD